MSVEFARLRTGRGEVVGDWGESNGEPDIGDDSGLSSRPNIHTISSLSFLFLPTLDNESKQLFARALPLFLSPSL